MVYGARRQPVKHSNRFTPVPVESSDPKKFATNPAAYNLNNDILELGNQVAFKRLADANTTAAAEAKRVADANTTAKEYLSELIPNASTNAATAQKEAEKAAEAKRVADATGDADPGTPNQDYGSTTFKTMTITSVVALAVLALVAARYNIKRSGRRGGDGLPKVSRKKKIVK